MSKPPRKAAARRAEGDKYIDPYELLPLPVHSLFPALQFDASFEDGNLESVSKVSDIEYDLFIRGDYEIPRERLPPKQSVWYMDIDRSREYILTIFFEFDDDSDEYEFAYCFPYSYSRLQRYIYSLTLKKLPYLTRTVICRTILFRQVDLLSIVSTPLSVRKPSVLLTARVHPGETPASFVLEGILDTALSSSALGNELRSLWNLYLVPMLNPDGVALGNYRTNRFGDDLNRVWKNPSPYFQPEIYYVKEVIDKLHKDPRNRLEFFFDLHGHTNSSNAMIYANPDPYDGQTAKSKRFLTLFEQYSKSFCAWMTRYDMNQEGCARLEMGRLYPNVQSFTFETSYSHYFDIEKVKHFFTPKEYYELGVNLCEALVVYKRNHF